MLAGESHGELEEGARRWLGGRERSHVHQEEAGRGNFAGGCQLGDAGHRISAAFQQSTPSVAGLL